MWLASRWRALDADGPAVRVEDDLALGQLELDRAAAVAGLEQALVGGVERLDDRLEQRAGALVGLAVRGRLHLGVGEPRAAAHEAAAEAPGAGSRHVRSMVIQTARQARSSSGRSEHRSLESASGSIGMTRSGK